MPRSLLRRSLWILMATALACGLVALGHTQRALAALREQAYQLGPALADFAELLGRETTVALNGQRLHLSTLTTDRDARALLDRFEALCRQSAPRLTAELTERAPHVRVPSGRPFLGVLRDERAGVGGVAACLAQPDDAGLRTLAARAATYATTRDLSAFGQLRAIFVRPGARGGTHVLLAWSDGPLSLAAMFPAHGDAAGSDLASVPRPEAARRLLSVTLDREPYGAVFYEAAGTPEQALAAYTRTLTAAGFRALSVAREHGAGEMLRALVRQNDQLIVTSFRHQHQTVIALARLSAEPSRKTRAPHAAATPDAPAKESRVD